MEDAEFTPPPSKLKTVIPFVAVLLLGAGGGYGASVAMAGQGAPGEAPLAEGEDVADGESPAEGEHGAAAGADSKAQFSAGITGQSVVSSLGTFTVNLRGSGGGRVLRMEVQVDSSSGSSTVVTERAAQLRDSIITGVSDYTWSELEGVDGKTRLRDELLARVNGVMAPAAVDRVYFTQFVVQ